MSKHSFPEKTWSVIAAKEIGLCINTDKTEYININQNNNMQMKSICGSVISEVEDFKYLGSYIRSTK